MKHYRPATAFVALLILTSALHAAETPEWPDLNKNAPCLKENWLPARTLVWAKPGENGVEISVLDTGIGIDPRYHKVIFEKFMQIENPLTRRYGGSGLGLPFAAQIVEAHGSAIRLESTLDKGSKFSFELSSGPIEAEGEPLLTASGRPTPGNGRDDE